VRRAAPGEFQLIQRLASKLWEGPGVALGPGDDAAVVHIGGKKVLLTTDLLIEGVHFRTDWMTPEEIGFKAMRVNLSDIAAMGGFPRFALISVGLPPAWRARKAERLFRGFYKAAREAGAAIVGGDTNASDRLVVNVALLGEAGGRVLTRGGARAGDSIYVTGELGASALGLAALKRGRRGFEGFVRRHKTPPLRVNVGRVLAKIDGIHAAIDLSDGLAGDLGHILEKSGVGAAVDVDALPRPGGFERAAERLGCDLLSEMLSGGEDYELAFTASSRVKIPRKISGVPVAKIGKITPKSSGLRWLRRDGTPVKGGIIGLQGFRHF
jgi:thiamine-monophosphate kinase